MKSFVSISLFFLLSLLFLSAVLAVPTQPGTAARLASRVGRVQVLYRAADANTQTQTNNDSPQQEPTSVQAQEEQVEAAPAQPAEPESEPEDLFDAFHSALSDAIIEEVNQNPNATWTAARNEYFEGKSYKFLQNSCGTKLDAEKLALAASPARYPWQVIPPVYPVPSAPSAFPAHFDAREKWGSICPSLHDIRDQAGCGSCWAVAATACMTDRHCIASNGAQQPYLSAHHMLTCCGLKKCGSCEGGYPIHGWQMWVDEGVVTGGGFGSVDTCQPYKWAPCQHYGDDKERKCKPQTSTPQCRDTCKHGVPFQEDKSFGASAFKVAFSEEAIKKEIFEHGPVEAGFMVYEDFPHYKSGVYSHVTGKALGGHAVKLLGWGEEGGRGYWLAANSWNVDWGAGGLFKIARGQNECFIEDMIFSGHVNKKN